MSSPRGVPPLHGEVWDAYLDPVEGREQGGRRPVVVVSNNALNTGGSQIAQAISLTTRDRGVPAHPAIPLDEGGLTRQSFALCDQLTTLSHRRFRRYRGTVSAATLAELTRVVHLIPEAEELA